MWNPCWAASVYVTFIVSPQCVTCRFWRICMGLNCCHNKAPIQPPLQRNLLAQLFSFQSQSHFFMCDCMSSFTYTEVVSGVNRFGTSTKIRRYSCTNKQTKFCSFPIFQLWQHLPLTLLTKRKSEVPFHWSNPEALDNFAPTLSTTRSIRITNTSTFQYVVLSC